MSAGAKEIRVVRSPRRTRTVALREKHGYIEVLAPATMSDAELQPIVEKLRRRLDARNARKQLSDAELQARAVDLNDRHFGGALHWQSIGWVANQEHRWGSCSPGQGTIRLSHRLADLPGWVVDYVIVHELAHLLEPSHNARFWKLVMRYRLTERARGYLMAVAGEAREGDM